MGMRFLSEEPLLVAPELIGTRLASPLRRAVAFGIDMVVLLVPSLAVSLGIAAIALNRTDPKALRAAVALFRESAPPESKRQALCDLAPLLVRLDAPGLPREVHRAVEDGDLTRAGDVLGTQQIIFAMAMGESAEPLVPKGSVRFPIERLIPAATRGLAFYGVAALYFGLFTAARRGATLGKRLLRVRVVRLDGEKLTLFESLERFVGYLHIPGTLFVGLIDFWRDPNRRLAHDRVAHTAVVRVMRPARTRS